MFASINIDKLFKSIELTLPSDCEDVELFDKIKKLQEYKEKYVNEWDFTLTIDSSMFDNVNSDADKKKRDSILCILDDIECQLVAIIDREEDENDNCDWPEFLEQLQLQDLVHDTTINEKAWKWHGLV